MKCEVCGLEYGLSHNCTGIAPLVTPEETAPAPGLRLAPFYYLEQSFRILTWDDAAVRRAAKDNNSLLYGFFILALGNTGPFVLLLLRNWGLGYSTPWNLVGIAYGRTLAFSLLWIIAQIWLAHVLAKLLFEAKGSYIALMRVYLLGQMYTWLIVIPIIGGMLAGIAVLMMAFEEVDGIERMKAFGLAVAIGITFWIGSIWLLTSGPWPIR